MADNDWQEVVREAARALDVIVFDATNFTNNLEWELREVLSVAPEKVFIICADCPHHEVRKILETAEHKVAIIALGAPGESGAVETKVVAQISDAINCVEVGRVQKM